MIKICRYIVILTMLFIIMADAAESTLPPSPDEQEISTINKSIRMLYDRNKHIGFEKLLDTGVIKISPGMTVLDIGTGPGYFAYRFAERLKGTGKVYATDILADRIDYVKKEAKRRGLQNIYPVLVKREGVDRFYGKHKYDLIFLSNVYHHFDKRDEYFRKMSEFLAEDGELIVIMYKSAFIFYKEDIADFAGLVKELSQELHENEPFYKRLRHSTQDLIKEQSNIQPDEALRKAIVDDFNQILLDPNFYNDFQRAFIYKTVSFLPAEEELYDWLLMCLKEEGALDKAQKDLNPKEIRAIVNLNRLLFRQRFRKYCGRVSPSFVKDLHKQTSKFLVERELSEAGFKLKKEYNSLPYHDILFFAADKDKNRQ